MKDETGIWIKYAEENLNSAKVLLGSGLLNPCLQNSQQTVEKALKALQIEHGLPLKKIHSINELVMMLIEKGFDVGCTDDERDLLDSIYLPSKYPLGSALPDCPISYLNT
jgi:HEPN domain-containing protein